MRKLQIIKNTVGVLLLSSFLSVSQMSFAVSLTEVATETLKTNPEVHVATNAHYAVEHTIDQARSGYFPKIDLSAGIGREWSNNNSTQPGSKNLMRHGLGVVIKQMIYDGSLTKSRVEQAKSLTEASAYQAVNTSEQVVFNAASAFINILRYEKLLLITQDNLDSHQSIFKQVKSRSAKGIDHTANIEQALARVARSHADLLATEGNFADAKTTYQRVTGNLPEGLEEPDEKCCDGLPSTLNGALEIALEKHPLLRSTVANYAASLSQIQTAQASMRPRVHLEIESGINRNIDGATGADEDVLAMIRLKHNLYNGGADKLKISETKYLSVEQKETAMRINKDVEEEVRLAWNGLDTAARNLPHLKTHADASKKSHAAYLQQFKIGKRSLLDLLDIENEMFIAQLDYISGQSIERIACYRLLASMGVLLETLGIESVESAVVAEK